MFSLVISTFPDSGSAGETAKALVSEGLASCVSTYNVHSTYRWEGAVEEADEVALHIKTRSQLVKKVIDRIRELHSYDVPEIIALRIDDGDLPYLEWIAESTQEYQP